MKLLLTAVLSCGALLCAQAQQISANYSVTELGPNHRVWHAPPNALTGQTHAPVVELRSGMNYWDPQQSAWLPSQPSFVDTGDAFVASRIQHKTRLERDINVEGAVSFLTPSGSTIRATPVAIALYNRINGQFALIGTLTNSTGSIVGPGADTVLYEDAYAGVVCASVAYRVAHGSLEQDVIFTGNLDAGAYNFPTNNNTLVQVISEIYESPAPDVTRNPVYVETNLTVRSRMASPDIMDETIAYDEHFFLGRGHAYTAPSSANTNGTAAVVSKELCVTPNGTFLIESVQYGAIRDALAALPDCVPTGGHASVRPSSGLENFCALLPKPPSAAHAKLASDRKPEKLASVTRLPAGLVIDFVANVAQNQPLFACDTNYIVAGTVNINVATTFEGGTVVKYQTGACLNLYGAVTCATALYRPVTLTAYDDNTVGEPVGSGNVSPNGYGNPAIYMGASTLSLTNFHIRYAQIGITSFGAVGTSLTVNDSQFVKCIQGIHIGGTGCGCGCGCGCGSLTVVLNNTLMATTTYPLSLSAGSCILNVGFYNCTVDHGSQVINGSYAYAVNVVSTNSSFTYNGSKGLGTYSGYKNGFYGNTGNWTFGSGLIQPPSSPYQSAGAGSYYLATSSPYRNAGTVNIGLVLLADLHQRTTDPPNITYLNTTISTATTFSPQVQRDIDPPDVGYHYDPLDYAVSGLTVTAPLSLINGVAVATYGTAAAITLSGSGQLLSQGLANNLNHVVRYNTVQEQSTTSWSSSTVGDAVGLGSATASAHCTFTAWSLLGGVGNHVNNQAYYTTPSWFAHNQFAGGQFTMHPGLVALTNCLWERVALTLNNNGSVDTWYLYNNLFHGGNITYSISGSGSMGMACDNLFDRTSITRSGSSAYFTSGYNGYVANCNQFENSGGHDQVLASNPVYLTGPLGRYYYPTTGGLLSTLINAGSHQAVDAGLYSFTTTTDQVIEGTSTVDIGFHYVALDANGNPLDSDGDGTPDYIPTPPTIVFGPLSQTVYWGDSVTFSVQVHGSPPFSYQWQFTPQGGSAGNISGATGSSLTFNNVDDSVAGSYSVQVVNLAGSTVSTNAALTVTDGYHGLAFPVVGPRQDYTFKNGSTYHIGSRVELYGVTTIEGGSVIKFDYASPSTLAVMGTLICKTDDPYVPAYLTSADDRSLGVIWSPPVPLPQAGNNGVPYLDLTSAQDPHPSLSNLRIRYADQGVTTPAAAKWLDLWDCEFLECNCVAVAGQAATVAFHNVLISDCNTGVKGAAAFAAITGEHLTTDVAAFWGQAQPSRIALTNSIIFGTLAGGPTLTSDHTAVNPPGPVFQPVGAGFHYLLSNSPYHQAGTTSVSPRLLTEFQQKSTQPPLELPGFWDMKGNLTLSPQTKRYTSGAPDYGFYYTALDYTVGAFINWGIVTVLPGTTIGFRNDSDLDEQEWRPGFDLCQGSALVSHGTPNKPVVFVDVQAVQEQFIWPCNTFIDPDFVTTDEDLPAPSLDLRFCTSYAQPGYWHVWSGGDASGGIWTGIDPSGGFYASLSSLVDWNLKDCTLHGGKITLGQPYLDMYNWVFGACAVCWTNNLFDNVGINLDPTYFEDGLNGDGLNCDMSFAAYNNLFRNCPMLRLEPTPATLDNPPPPSNWVFRDNLFDKVSFLQDIDHCALVFDHNAYWPMTTAELAWALATCVYQGAPNASQLLTQSGGGGTAEQILTAAPPYQPGPLGCYYLPNTTQLYHAGSRTADAAGLFHYTTCTNQTKEGSGQMANIGLHYVGTTSSTSTSPKDSDGDLIPDYVENWHGDGDTGLSRVHTADETDWNNPTTDTDPVTQLPIADSVNTKYDDIDLSGNGIVGRIKKALNMQPFDTSNPLTLTQTITGQEPDIVSFKVGRVVGGQFVALSYDLLTSIGVLNLNRDGFDVTVENCAPVTGGNDALLSWNTTYDPPGLRLLQPRLLLNGTGVDSAILSGLGPLVAFYSANVCRFFESDAMFDQNGAYLDAQLPVPNATYSIQIFDPSTSPRTLLKTIPTKSTSNGMIQEDWLLDCDQGPSPFAGSAFDAVFDITLLDGPGGAPVAHGTPTKRHGEIIATEQGNGFDVAYMYTPRDGTLAFAFSDPLGPVWIGMQAVVDTLAKPGLWPGHYDSSFDQFTWSGLWLGYPGYVGSAATIAVSLFPSMSDAVTKNFYCYAHGTANSLLNYAGDVKITAGGVAALLGNKGLPGFPFAVPPSNPYRFVFLDGCHTASDNQWRHAFGIMPLGPPDQAARPKLGPQAFVGWSGLKSAWLDGFTNATGNLDLNMSQAVQSAYTATLQLFYSDWMNGNALLTCLQHATDTNRVPCALPTWMVKEFTIGAPFASPSFTVTNSYHANIYIYGHPGLTRNGLNSEADRYYQFDAPSNRH